ncbi:MAG: hypothetical protein M2R45_00965 [Verrucomicrobia subdivision 3 bacterium]|nr:hypothetical protein [Limisphaerales bacterium]MCS1414633.1 hypothetical protein [Limisphaerales bacterium]
MYRIGISLVIGGVAALVALGAAEPKWTLRTASSEVNYPPIPSIADSPIKFLAALIATDTEKREKMLASRTEERQAFWKRKIAEYEQYPESVREARLRTAQLHWYLALLIRVPMEVRVAKLKQIPEIDRVLVKRRLEQWDELPDDLRVDILDNIKVMQYFARLVSSSPEQRAALLKTSKAPDNPMNDSSLSWQNLSSKRRQQMFDAYARFYELPLPQQETALKKVPIPVRKEFEKRLEELLRMPLDQRQKCIVSLHAFAQMRPEERTRFRGNAERWRAMEPDERHFWMNYVKRLPLPLPPVRVNRAKLPLNKPSEGSNTGASG